jgi:hypothetical protein
MDKLKGSSILEVLGALTIISISMLVFFQVLGVMHRLTVKEDIFLEIGTNEKVALGSSNGMQYKILENDTVLWVN